MSFLLEKKLDHESKCEAAIRQAHYSDAVFHAAKAAEYAFGLAESTQGTISARYVNDGEAWLEIAERLKTQPPTSRPTDKKGKREGEDEQASESLANDWLVASRPNVSFDQIAGMQAAKEVIQNMIIHPLKKPEIARSLGLKPGGGMILFGPPGNGKTLLGKAIAGEIDAPFYYASGAQIRSKWHGESEQRLRQLIQEATANPLAVLFFDEVEGLLPKRGEASSVVDNRIVTQFLSEIGGFQDRDNILLLLGATNCPWDIDEAVFRTGRFDEKIFIGLPDAEARRGILNMHLKAVALQADFDVDSWAEKMDGYTGSDIVGIVNAAKRACLSRSVREDSEPIILAEDFETAFLHIPASVTPDLMTRYEAFSKARF